MKKEEKMKDEKRESKTAKVGGKEERGGDGGRERHVAAFFLSLS